MSSLQDEDSVCSDSHAPTSFDCPKSPRLERTLGVRGRPERTPAVVSLDSSVGPSFREGHLACFFRVVSLKWEAVVAKLEQGRDYGIAA